MILSDLSGYKVQGFKGSSVPSSHGCIVLHGSKFPELGLEGSRASRVPGSKVSVPGFQGSRLLSPDPLPEIKTNRHCCWKHEKGVCSLARIPTPHVRMDLIEAFAERISRSLVDPGCCGRGSANSM